MTIDIFLVRLYFVFLGSQQINTCSQFTIETLGKGVKYCSKLTIKAPEPHH